MSESSHLIPSSLQFGNHHLPYVQGEIKFSHDDHALLDCSTCHEEGVQDGAPSVQKFPSMATCFECHHSTEQPADCEQCHVENRKGRKPRFHTGTWVENHKTMAYDEGYKCNLCHGESECQSCHSSRRPRSHTPRFNRSEHGRLAVTDRQSCATCHSSDFCSDCHNRPPPDHTPAFRSPVGHRQLARLKLRTCLTCHPFATDCAGSGCHDSL